MPRTPAPTLPTAPVEHLAMDYARLRAEGLRRLGELAGSQWTDFNAHDPGVTLLESLCYAITDLAYRIDFPVPDLLAGPEHDGGASLPSAATILGCEPVTAVDLRKLALDASAAANGWVTAAREHPCPVYFHRASRTLHLDPDPSAVEAGPLTLAGLHTVALPTGSDHDAAGRAAAFTRLHAARPLGEDLGLAISRSPSGARARSRATTRSSTSSPRSTASAGSGSRPRPRPCARPRSASSAPTC